MEGSDRRTVIVGMNNPLSDDTRHALAPYPVNCAGWRVWRMLDDAAKAERYLHVRVSIKPPGQEVVVPERYSAIHRQVYMDAFDRRNVLHARTWSRAEARAAGADLGAQLVGRRVVVLGVQTLEALGWRRPPWCEWQESDGDLLSETTLGYALLPHPSGRCREYNDPALRAAAGVLLLEEFKRGEGVSS